MEQIRRQALQVLLLACGIGLGLASQPLRFLKISHDACESDLRATDYLTRNEYAEGIFTWVTYDILANGDQESSYDASVLRKALLNEDGELSDSYADVLPTFADLPEPVMNSFAYFACTFHDESTNTISKFCASYENGDVKAKKVPSTGKIVFSDLKNSEAKQVANVICKTVSKNWGDLIDSATQFYVDQGFVNANDASTDVPTAAPRPDDSNNVTSDANSDTTSDATNSIHHIFTMSFIVRVNEKSKDRSAVKKALEQEISSRVEANYASFSQGRQLAAQPEIEDISMKLKSIGKLGSSLRYANSISLVVQVL